MHRSRVIFSFYCLTGIAAAFLTWASRSLLGEVSFLKGIDPGQSITKMNIGDGLLTIGCFAVILILLLTGKNKLSLGWKKTWWISVIALASLLVGVYNLLTIFSLSAAKTDDTLVMKVSPGVGLYLTIMVSLLLVILPFKQKTKEEKEKVEKNK